MPVLDAVWDPVFEAAGLLATDFEAADFEADALAVPVFAGTAAWGTAFDFVLVAVAAFFFAV